jgi:hypothetical protein
MYRLPSLAGVSVRAGHWLKAGPLGFKFEAADREKIADLAGDLVRSDLERLPGTDDQLAPSDGGRPSASPARLPEVARLLRERGRIERERRAEIEELITKAVGYGWNVAQTGRFENPAVSDLRLDPGREARDRPHHV